MRFEQGEQVNQLFSQSEMAFHPFLLQQHHHHHHHQTSGNSSSGNSNSGVAGNGGRPSDFSVSSLLTSQQLTFRVDSSTHTISLTNGNFDKSASILFLVFERSLFVSLIPLLLRISLSYWTRPAYYTRVIQSQRYYYSSWWYCPEFTKLQLCDCGRFVYSNNHNQMLEHWPSSNGKSLFV